MKQVLLPCHCATERMHSAPLSARRHTHRRAPALVRASGRQRARLLQTFTSMEGEQGATSKPANALATVVTTRGSRASAFASQSVCVQGVMRAACRPAPSRGQVEGTVQRSDLRRPR
jgi:hypothetical protein